MLETIPRSARWDIESLRTFLNRLDSAQERFGGREKRTADRHPYRRPSLDFDILDDDRAPLRRLDAIGRNLSRGGIGLVAERMVYPDTPCRLHLVGPGDVEQRVMGQIRHCRYIVGSGSLYDIGAQFERPVDVAIFVPRARLIRILMADTDPNTSDLAATFLDGMNVELKTSNGPVRRLISGAMAEKLDLLLIDLENEEYDALQVVQHLRTHGFVGAIVATAVRIDSDLAQRCEAAGCTGYLRKPITRGAFRRLVMTLITHPVVSSLAHDPRMGSLIDRFVSELSERAQEMAAAFESGRLDDLHRLAHRLSGEAGSYGFEPISDAATELRLRLAMHEAQPLVRLALDQVLTLCRGARPVSCIDVATLPG